MSQPKKHVRRGRCWCSEFHGESPRTIESVLVDLEAVVGNAKVLMYRYRHEYDFAYRGRSSSILVIGGGHTGDDEGPVPNVQSDERKQQARSQLRNAEQSVANAVAALRAAQRSLDRIHGGRMPGRGPAVQANKGPYYVEALAAQEKRRARGDE